MEQLAFKTFELQLLYNFLRLTSIICRNSDVFNEH
jgi:hypothetical protein